MLDRRLTIVASSDAYLEATLTRREAIVGRYVFDVFPDNPHDPTANAVANSTASFNRVLALKMADAMPAQRHDVRVSEGAQGDPRFEVKYWKPVNTPLIAANGEVGWILHAAEDVTEAMRSRFGDAATPTPKTERRRIVDELRGCNGMLGNLPDALFNRLADHLSPVEIPAGMILAEALKPLTSVCFPVEGLNAAIVHLADGSSVEAAIGGRGGMVGVSALTGAAVEDAETRALISGSALRIAAGDLCDLLAVHPDLRAQLSWFVSMLMAQTSLTLACNARHSVDQRLARWLLTASSRIGSLDVPVTQETISLGLGIRRSGVSESLSRFAAHGLIANGRQLIRVLDRSHLAAHACDGFPEAEAARERYADAQAPSSAPASARILALIHRYRRLAGQPGNAAR